MFRAVKISGIIFLIKEIGICVEGKSKKDVSTGIIALVILILLFLLTQMTTSFSELGERFQILSISL